MPTYKYPRPAVTVDCVVFGVQCGDGDCRLQVLLVRRAGAPFKGRFALPGGFVNMGESIDAAAYRELREEAGVHDLYLEQLYTFGEPGRDPRGRVISVAYYALVDRAAHEAKAGSDATEAEWHDVAIWPGGWGSRVARTLAFDHSEILARAIGRLRAKVRYAPIGFELLPKTFAIGQIQSLYEAVLGVQFDASNFRKKILKTGLLVADGGMERGVPHRPAPMYRFDRERYESLSRKGFSFEV